MGPSPDSIVKALFQGPEEDDDHEKAKRVLTGSGLADALGPLIQELRATNSWELYFQPDRIWLRVRAYAMSDEAVAAWLGGVRALAPP